MDDLFAAREAMEDGISRADQHADPDWKERALATVRELAETQPTILVDDVWQAGLEKPKEARAIGPVLLEARRRGWISKAPVMRPSAQPTSHMALRPVWQSELYQPNPYEDVGRERKARALAGVLYRLDRDLPGQKSGAPLSERAAAMDEEFWNTLAHVAGRPKGPSRATVVRAIEMLQEAEARKAAS